MLNPQSLAKGNEQYETFTTSIGRKKIKKVQYDYRHNDGELFSCIKSSIEECRAAKENWLKNHKKAE